MSWVYDNAQMAITATYISLSVNLSNLSVSKTPKNVLNTTGWALKDQNDEANHQDRNEEDFFKRGRQLVRRRRIINESLPDERVRSALKTN